MDITLQEEMINLGRIVDRDGSQPMHALYAEYQMATVVGDEEKARMAKAFILARTRMV